MSLRIPFGKRSLDGRLVDPSSVSSGLACACVCPQCGEQLVARHARTTNRASHFAHSSGGACAGAFETALHKAAKQIVSEAFQVGLNFGQTGMRYAISFDEAHVERAFADFVPDVLTRHESGHQMAFEILVTHAIDTEKEGKIRRARLTCFELDLSMVRRLITYEELRTGICEGRYPCRLIHDDFLGIQARLETELALFRPQKYRALVKRRQEEEAKRAIAQQKQQEWKQKMPWLD
jgi:hypothetical protein